MTDPALTALTDDFDLDGWIDGTCKVTVTAKVYQRGDLITRLDELAEQIETTKKIPKEQRGANDVGVDTLMDEWEALAEQVAKSAMVLHIQDRTEERRRKVRDGLKQKGLSPDNEADSETIILHLMADAIVKVELNGKTHAYDTGFPVEKLRKIKDQLGDAALFPLREAYFKAISEAPTISAPLSRNISSRRGGGI